MRTRTFLPRPEYPRPERQRSFLQGVDWVNLNGPWDFRFDPGRVGLEQRWFDQLTESWPDQIIVPFCWESLAAWGEADAAGNENYFSTRAYLNPLDVTRLNYRSAARHEVGWYRRQVKIPRSEVWNGKRVIVTVGAADFFTEGWCNGRPVGSNEGGYNAFEFDITETLVAVEGQLTGTLILRVEDPMHNHDQPVGKQWGWYSSASGIWQTVFVEPRSAEYMRHFQIVTEPKEERAQLAVYLSSDSGKVDVEVTNPRGEKTQVSGSASGGVAHLQISLESPVYWDPNAPELYRLRLSLEGGDIVHSYFGVRTLSAESGEESEAPGTLCLNGEPIYLRGALYQSYHPEGIYTAGDVESLRDDILYAKRAGFDLLRIHIKVDDPLLLYLADTLGILLMADMPNFGEGGDTEVGRRRYETMLRQTIARDYNHPSIVAWCLFNETWGFGGQSEFVSLINPEPVLGENFVRPASGTKLANESAYQWIQQMFRLAKQLDSARLIEDMSVVAWEHLEYYGHGETDVNSWHFYTHDYDGARKNIANIVEKTYAGSTFNYVPGFQQGNQPLINSEYGGVAALDGDIDTSWSFKFLTNELRRHGKLSAYIYTELHDVEWERNGFLNYDRTPKEFGYDPTIVNHGDVLPIDSPPIRHCAPGEIIGVEVFSSHFSRRRREEVTLHWRLSGIDSLGWLHDELASGIESIPFAHLKVELAKRLELAMPNETMLCTLWARAFTRDGDLVARNYVQFHVESGFPAREEKGACRIYRLDADAWFSGEWSEGMSTREESQQTNSCFGRGRGFYEWRYPIPTSEIRQANRLTVLCEASSHREGTPQTDPFTVPTTMRMLLNGVAVYQSVLPNHPHDARGALSYLRGGRGAYGYLSHAAIEGDLLREVVARARGQHLRLRLTVPKNGAVPGGLTVYGSACGRYPVAPTIVIE